MAEKKEKTERIFYMKGRDAAEYFRITREEFLKALKDIREILKKPSSQETTILEIGDIIRKTIGGI